LVGGGHNSKKERFQDSINRLLFFQSFIAGYGTNMSEFPAIKKLFES
jgi:hypothetical protein